MQGSTQVTHRSVDRVANSAFGWRAGVVLASVCTALAVLGIGAASGSSTADSFATGSRTRVPTVDASWVPGPALTVDHIDASVAAVNGEVLVFGGYYKVAPITYTLRVESFDPVSRKWRRLHDLPAPMSHVGTAVVDNRYVYLAGGFTSIPSTSCAGDNPCETFGTTTVWRYDAVADSYTAVASLPQPRGSGGMVLVGRTLHFVGGVDPDRLEQLDHWTLNVDDQTAEWQPATPLPAGAGRTHFGIGVHGTRIYVFGGQTGFGTAIQDRNDGLVLDTASTEPAWVPIAKLPAPRSEIAQTVVATGKGFLVLSGSNPPNHGTNSQWRYDALTDAWSVKPTVLPDARYSALLTVLGTQMYYVGGSPSAVGKHLYIAPTH